MMKSPTFAKQTSQGDTSMSACFLKSSVHTVIFSIIEVHRIAEMESQPLTGRLAICTNVCCFLYVLNHAYHRHCCRERLARVPGALAQLGHIVWPFCIGVWHVSDGFLSTLLLFAYEIAQAGFSKHQNGRLLAWWGQD